MSCGARTRRPRTKAALKRTLSHELDRVGDISIQILEGTPGRKLFEDPRALTGAEKGTMRKYKDYIHRRERVKARRKRTKLW